MAAIKLKYVSWISTKLQKDSDEFLLPEHIITVSDLIDWLHKVNGAYKEAFEYKNVVYAAREGKIISHSERINSGEEITFFAPIAGG